MLTCNAQTARRAKQARAGAASKLIASGPMPHWATKLEMSWVRRIEPMPVYRPQQGFLLAEVWREIRMAIRSMPASRGGCSRLVSQVAGRRSKPLNHVGRLMTLHGPETPRMRARNNRQLSEHQVEIENLGSVFHVITTEPEGVRVQVPRNRTIGQWRIRNGRVIRSGALRRRRGPMPRRGQLPNGVVEQRDGAMGWSIFNDGTSLLMEQDQETNLAYCLWDGEQEETAQITGSSPVNGIWQGMTS
ncbi:hypothetical protein [Magnetococcus sp. PR-3]|uniref:hypothetical protein n=1 Tax=Magnetococcus sp. PR-3 TaxID=3120355 RepID=UPI002FCE29DA